MYGIRLNSTLNDEYMTFIYWNGRMKGLSFRICITCAFKCKSYLPMKKKKKTDAHQALLMCKCWTRKQILTDTLFPVVRITPKSRIACTSVATISVCATMSASSVIIVTFIAVSWFCAWSVAVAAAVGRRGIVAATSHGFITTRTIGRVPRTPRSPPSISRSIGWRWRWRRWRVRRKRKQ